MKYLPLLLLALIWEAIVQFGLVSRDLLPSLSDVAKAGWQLAKDGEFWTNGAASMWRGSAGLALAIVIGGGVGVPIGRWGRVGAVFGAPGGAGFSLAQAPPASGAARWVGSGGGPA